MSEATQRLSKVITDVTGVTISPEALAQRGGGEIPAKGGELEHGFETLVWISGETDSLILESLPPYRLTIPDRRKAETLEFCLGVNDDLRIGAVSLNPEDSETKIHFVTVQWEASALSEQTLAQLVKGHLETFEAMVPVIAAVAQDGLDLDAARSRWWEAIDRHKLRDLLRR